MNRSLQPSDMFFAIGLTGLGVLAVIHHDFALDWQPVAPSGYLAARLLPTPQACSCSAAPLGCCSVPQPCGPFASSSHISSCGRFSRFHPCSSRRAWRLCGLGSAKSSCS
jgi:hypothetical protein